MCVCAYNIFLMLFLLLSLLLLLLSCPTRPFGISHFSVFFFLLLFPSPALLTLPPPLALSLAHPSIANCRVACRFLPASARDSSPRPDRPTFPLTSTAAEQADSTCLRRRPNFHPACVDLAEIVHSQHAARAGVFRPILQCSRPAPVPIRTFGADVVIRHFWPSPADGAGFSSRRGPVTVDAS